MRINIYHEKLKWFAEGCVASPWQSLNETLSSDIHSSFNLDYTILPFLYCYCVYISLLFPLCIHISNSYPLPHLFPFLYLPLTVWHQCFSHYQDHLLWQQPNLILGDGAIMLDRQCGVSKRIQLLESCLGFDRSNLLSFGSFISSCLSAKAAFPGALFTNIVLQPQKMLWEPKVLEGKRHFLFFPVEFLKSQLFSPADT